MKAGEAVVYVLVPVLDRPERVEPLVASLKGAQGAAHTRPVFVVGQHDRRERTAVKAAGELTVVLKGERLPGDYARKMNLGYRTVMRWGANDSKWVFLGADDLCFCPGWADRAIEAAADIFDVVGTNDLGNPSVTSGQHSTHSLVRCGYIGTIDEPDVLLHEGYSHTWVDNEFVATAKRRGTFVHAADSWVEHLHPHWGKGTTDATYELGQRSYEDDALLFRRREIMWA